MIYTHDINFVLPDDFVIQSGTNAQVTKSGNVYTVSATDTITTLQNDLGITITDSGTDSNHNYTIKATASSSMPTGQFVEWTLNSSHSDSPPAPANGYAVLSMKANAGEYVMLHNLKLGAVSIAPFNGISIFCFIPLRKDNTAYYQYDASGGTDYFGFVYAAGSL